MMNARMGEELVAAYSAGHLSRREFVKRMALVAGGTLGAALLASRPVLAEDDTINGEDPPAATAKKSTAKKGTAKKPTPPPPPPDGEG
jgi:hypothetical protein